MKKDVIDSKPKIIAHRCNGFGHPENSMNALRAAVLSKADAVEIDVRITKDLKWIVIHNPHFTNENKQVERVNEKNYDDIKQEAILLEQMLFIISRSNKELYLDVKDAGEEEQLIVLLQKYKMVERTVLISWEPYVLQKAHQIDKNLRLGFSYVPIHRVLKSLKIEFEDPLTPHKGRFSFNTQHSFDANEMKGYSRQHYLSTIPDIKVPLYSVQVYAPFCSTKLVNLAHEKGIKIFPFTIDTKVSYTVFKLRLVDGIITNKTTTFTDPTITQKATRKVKVIKEKIIKNKLPKQKIVNEKTTQENATQKPKGILKKTGSIFSNLKNKLKKK